MAREGFEACLADSESGETAEGLSWAAWWLGLEQLTIGARERAYRAYRVEGDGCGAARAAIWLASDHLDFRGADAIAESWIERARSLLDDQERCSEHGWLALIDADIALRVRADALSEAARLSLEAAELGRELGVADLEAVGLAQAGSAFVAQGRIEEGMRRIEEACSIALAEDFELALSPGWVLCSAISANEGVGDFPRAAQFCGTMQELADRWGGRHFAGVCRSTYGNVLATSGDWEAAEGELVASVGDLRAVRPAMVAGSLARLGALRARQGRNAEAREHYREAGTHPMALVGLGELALGDDDAEAAADIADRVLRNLPDDALLPRLPAIELLALSQIAQDDLAAARSSADELADGAKELDTAYLLGRASAVTARLAAAEGNLDDARRSCEDAIDRFDRSSAPYEEANARVLLAEILHGLGRAEAARDEAEAARVTFDSLGASADAERALRLSAGDAGSAGKDGTSELSPRELEVLRLIAQGMNNADIAEKLVVSPHTVHRHVANIRAKLRLPSRAAAVAYASREGLL